MGKIYATLLLHAPFPLFDMQHDHVLKKLKLDLLTPSQGRRGRGLWAKCLLPCCFTRHSLKFDMHCDCILKTLNFDLLIPPPRVGRGVYGQNICYHVAACIIPFNLIMQHDHILKKLNFGLCPTPKSTQGDGPRPSF